MAHSPEDEQFAGNCKGENDGHGSYQVAIGISQEWASAALCKLTQVDALIEYCPSCVEYL